MSVIDSYFKQLRNAGNDEAFPFTVAAMPGEVDILQVVPEACADIPIYMSISKSQLLCIAHLFREQDVNLDKELEMLRVMVEMNIPMPLSSFGKTSDLYVVFGAMAADSSFDDVLFELKTLCDNAREAYRMMAPFLKAEGA